MATVQKRGKKYYAVFKGADGKWHQQVAYTDKTKSVQYARRLEDEQRAIAVGDVDPQAEAHRAERAKSATDHLIAFRAHMEANGRTANHINYTIKDIERCLEHAGVSNAAALTLSHVDAFRAHCVTVGFPDHRHDPGPENPPRPDSRKTANRRIASVRAWLRFLEQRGAVQRVILTNYKMLHTDGHETRHRRALTSAEVKALILKTPDDHRRELYRFALLSGLRKNECAGITAANLNFERKTITVPALLAKAKKDQTIPMHPDLVEPLKKLSGGKLPTTSLFTVPNRSDVVGILHADCAQAEVDTTGIDFHSLRHTFCTLLAEAGTRPDVLHKLARHRDAMTTLKYYVHTRPDDEHAALARLSA